MAIRLELRLFQCSRLNVYSKLHSTDAPKPLTEYSLILVFDIGSIKTVFAYLSFSSRSAFCV